MDVMFLTVISDFLVHVVVAVDGLESTVTDRIIEKNKMVKCPGATRATPKCFKKKVMPKVARVISHCPGKNFL